MASKKTQIPETRQFTLNLVMADPVDDAIAKWIDATVEATGAKPPILIKAAIHHGSAEAGRRATERYEKLKAIDGEMFNTPAPPASPEADPPAQPANDLAAADPGKVFPKCQHPGTCRECSEKVAVGSWIRHYADTTIRCEKCEKKAA